MKDNFEKKIINLTQKLISFRTTSERTDQLALCANFIADFFLSSGLTVSLHQNNGVPSVVVTKGTKTPTVFLSGHFDVVEGSNTQFNAELKADRLFGRGAFDMKGSVAVLMLIMKELAHSEHSLGLMLTGDEEMGSKNGTYYLLEQGYNCKVALLPDGGETLSKIVSNEKGTLRVKLIAYGKQSHGARPWLGNNAVHHLIAAISEVATLFPPVNSLPSDRWANTINIGFIEGGKIWNQVPDQAAAGLDIRFTEEHSTAQIFKEIKRVVPTKIDAEIHLTSHPYSLDKSNEYVIAYRQTLSELGIPPEYVKTHGATDARFFAAKNIPVIVNQPTGDGHHGPEEWVSWQSLAEYYNLVTRFLDKIS